MTTDLDIYLLDITDTTVLSAGEDDNTGAFGTQFPHEYLDHTVGVTTDVQLVVARRSGSIGAPRFKVVFFDGYGIIDAEYLVPSPGDTVGPTVTGHGCAPNMISLWSHSRSWRRYDSGILLIPRPVHFLLRAGIGTTPAAPIAPLTVAKPELVASHCVSTTFFYQSGPPYIFCGTSAASPHGAAVAALLMSFRPAATPALVQNVLIAGAAPMSGGPNAVGAGRIDALASMNALAAALGSPPVATKAFAPTTITAGANSTLTITLTNPTATALTGVSFTDAFPAGLVVSAAPNLTNTCGGTATGTAGGNALSLTGGNLAGNAGCAVTIAVTSASASPYLNSTGPIASSAGAGTAATATLTVTAPTPPPVAAKAFTPSTITLGANSTLIVTLTNPTGTALTGVSLTDSFPAGLVVATAPNLTNTCGGTAAGSAGSNVLSLTSGSLAGNGSCSVAVVVTTAVAGPYLNSTGPIASSAGPGTAATATLTVTAPTPPPVAVKAFAPSTITAGANSTLTVTLTNPAATALTGLAFTDNFPAGLVVSITPNLTSTCGGTATGTAGSASLILTGGSLAGNAIYTVTVLVTSATAGAYPNSTGPIASSAGAGTAATATLTVTAVNPCTQLQLINCQSTTNNNPSGTAVATSTTATGSITATCQGTGTITAGRYAASPVGQTPFTASNFFDVKISSPNTCTTLTIVDCDLAGATPVQWWNALTTSWQPVSNQTFSPGPPPCVTMTLTAATSPSIAQMTGTIFSAQIAVNQSLAPIPQVFQNPNAIQSVLGGIGNGTRNNTPVPGATAPVNPRSAALANDQATVAPAAPLILRPPNTGDAGLAAPRRWRISSW